MASRALVIWRREKPISSSGTAMAGGGGDVDSRLLGSDRAAENKKSKYCDIWDTGLNLMLKHVHSILKRDEFSLF